jgi:hypothetical protein
LTEKLHHYVVTGSGRFPWRDGFMRRTFRISIVCDVPESAGLAVRNRLEEQDFSQDNQPHIPPGRFSEVVIDTIAHRGVIHMLEIDP